MTMPSVSIIILQYNNSQDTIRCLESVKGLEYPNFEVIVVDNASKLEHLNNTRLFVESQPRNIHTYALRGQANSRYHLITSKENLGYSGGNNAGIKLALQNHADYVLILNPDSVVEADLLLKLIKKSQSEQEIGIVGPAINEYSDKRERVVYGGLIEWLKPELKHLESYLPNSAFFISGAAILIKGDVFEKIGFLDERYFLYFEDADFCLRAKKAGYKLAIANDALIRHQISSTTGSMGNSLLLRYHYRNSHLFNWKNGPIHIKIALPFWSFFIIIKQLIKIVFVPPKRQISLAILRGIIDFYTGKFGKIQ